MAGEGCTGGTDTSAFSVDGKGLKKKLPVFGGPFVPISKEILSRAREAA